MTVSKFRTWWDYLQVAPQPPWWWKFELNNPGWKLSICATLITILRYLEAKFDYSYFMIFFWVIVLRFYTKNFKSFQAKMKPWHWFSRFKIKSKFGKIAVTPSFLLEMTWNFLCRIWNHNPKKIIQYCVTLPHYTVLILIILI